MSGQSVGVAVVLDTLVKNIKAPAVSRVIASAVCPSVAAVVGAETLPSEPIVYPEIVCWFSTNAVAPVGSSEMLSGTPQGAVGHVPGMFSVISDKFPLSRSMV